MRRRSFIATLAGTSAAGLAGCALPDEDRHPFAGRTVRVRIDTESETSHDLASLTRGALDYWEEHSQAYVGFPVDFEVVDADDPDMVVRFVDRPDDCHAVPNYSDRVLGCAPIIRPGQQLSGTVRAIVVAGARPVGKITITTKHELGHILGLNHDDDPQEIMSTDPALRIPMYELRIELWEEVLGAHENASNGMVLFNKGSSAWADGNYEDAEAEFRDAKVAYESARAAFESVRDRIEMFAEDSRVETVDLETLRDVLERLIERMRLAEEFARAMVTAAGAAAADDRETVTDALSTANDRIAAFNEAESPELRDVAIALGLVRGFDRDEPVVEDDVDEDEIEA